MSRQRAILSSLIRRCDLLAVEAGRIVLHPASGDQATADAWLREHYHEVLAEILAATGQLAFRYVGYSTGGAAVGRHSQRKLHKGTLTIQFSEIRTGEEAFACFNVELTRQRSTAHGKKGEPLPKGKFYPLRNSGFREFWGRTGIAEPPEFHCYMGRLKGLVMTGKYREQGRKKLANPSLNPLTITHDQIIARCVNSRYSTDNSPINSRQLTDNSPISATDKETAQSLQPQGLAPHSATRALCYGNKVKGNTVKGNKGHTTPLSDHIPGLQIADPDNQSIDEWLGDYSSADQTTNQIY